LPIRNGIHNSNPGETPSKRIISFCERMTWSIERKEAMTFSKHLILVEEIHILFISGIPLNL
jgi:hypothetical protein